MNDLMFQVLTEGEVFASFKTFDEAKRYVANLEEFGVNPNVLDIQIKQNGVPTTSAKNHEDAA